MAVSLLEALKTEQLEADLIVYNAVMSACSRASAWKPALALLESLDMESLQSDLITYSVCISACSKADEWRNALQLLEGLEDTDQQADLWIYSAAINACGRGEQWQQSVALLSKMQQDQLEADIIAYSTVISSCAKSGQWEQALMFLGAMRRQELQGDVVTQNSILNALAQVQRWERAMDFLEASGCDQVDGFAKSALIKGATAGATPGNWQIALALHQPAMTGRAGVLGSFNALLASSSGDIWHRGLEVLRMLRLNSLEADEVTGNTMVTTCVRWQDAFRCLFGLSWLKHNVKGYTSALEQCATAEEDEVQPWQWAVQLIGVLNERQVQADVGFWTVASSRLGRRCWQQMLDVLETESLPNLARESPWQVSLRLLDQDFSAGSPFHLASHNGAMTACVEAEEWQVALELFRTLEEEQLPDLWSYSAALTACKRALQWQQSEDLMSRIINQQLEVDLVTYSAALSCCAESRRWEVALQYFDQMQKSRLQADATSYDSLMSALVTSSEGPMKS